MFYECQVACRDDVPCPEGLVCDQGQCVEPDTDDGGPGGGDGQEDEGCSCQAGGAAGGNLLILLLLIAAIALTHTNDRNRAHKRR
jgi:hypothetical protein